MRSAALLLLLAAAGAARAQEAPVGAPPMPEAPTGPLEKKDAKSKPPPVTPLALSVSLAFSSGTWARVGVSTESAPAELAGLIKRGLYRIELLQLVLLAEASGKPLSELAAERANGKKTLRELSKANGVEYETLYESALGKAREVERRVESVLRVEALPAEGSGP